MSEQLFGEWPKERAEPVPGRGGERTPIGIWPLICWAFQREKVGLDFTRVGALGGRPLPGFGMEYVMMERAKLDVGRIDGGGQSHPHDDAALIADELEILPAGCGGREMAIYIAGLARAGLMPDCMIDRKPKLVPAEWRKCKHGVRAKVAVHHVERWISRGRVRERKIMYCPVVYATHASEIAAARRRYQQWRLALIELRTTLKAVGLVSFRLTDDLPDPAPWKKTS